MKPAIAVKEICREWRAMYRERLLSMDARRWRLELSWWFVVVPALAVMTPWAFVKRLRKAPR